MADDVVVTGMGATTPLGGDLASTWAAMLAGESGIAMIEDEWAADLPVRIAARLKVDPAEVLSRVEARRMDRCEQAAMVSAREAWADAGSPGVDSVRLAVVIGTGVGGVITTLDQDDLLERSGPKRLSPYAVPMLMGNGPAAYVSMELGARGGAHTPVSACASGAEALALGLDLIRSGRVDVVLAGGAETCIHPLTMAAFAQMRALSTRTDAAASRPFDVARDGFVMGEGAACVVLERAEFAAARSARTHGRLAGAGVTSSAQHITASDADGQARAMRIALRAGDIDPTDVGHVHAHATSTPQGDVVEAEAIAEVLGTHPVVTATKSMTGHLIGASGTLGGICALLALRDGVVPATRNLDELDPQIKIDVVTGEPRRGEWRAAVANSFGFGGHNVTLAFTTA